MAMTCDDVRPVMMGGVIDKRRETGGKDGAPSPEYSTLRRRPWDSFRVLSGNVMIMS